MEDKDRNGDNHYTKSCFNVGCIICSYVPYKYLKLLPIDHVYF